MKDRIYGLIKEGEKFRDSSKYAEALVLFKKALALSRKAGDLDGILDSTLATADIYRMIGGFDAAVKNYEEALEVCEALDNNLTGADCMVGIGLSLRAMGLWKDSIKFISAAKKVYKKEGDKKGAAFSLWAEAGALRVAGDIGKAIEKFKESKTAFSAIKFKSGVAYALCGLGGAHRISGKYKESLEYYKRANSMFSALKDKFGTAYSHCGIGNAYRMANKYSDAMKHFKNATRIYKEIGDIVSYSYTLWSIANVYKIKEDYTNAMLHVQTAQKNFKKTRDPRGIIYCEMTQGEIAFMQGKEALAVKKFKSALEGAEQRNFKLETCHARMLLSQTKACMPFSKSACYKKIGVDTGLMAIPTNMP